MSNHCSIIIIIHSLLSYSAIECKVYITVQCIVHSIQANCQSQTNNISVWSGLSPLQWTIERYKIVSSHSFWLFWSVLIAEIAIVHNVHVHTIQHYILYIYYIWPLPFVRFVDLDKRFDKMLSTYKNAISDMITIHHRITRNTLNLMLKKSHIYYIIIIIISFHGWMEKWRFEIWNNVD